MTHRYLNTVETFGVATAGHWWGRLAAMLGRAAHYLLGQGWASWILLYADDGKILMTVQKHPETGAALLVFYTCIGPDVK